MLRVPHAGAPEILGMTGEGNGVRERVDRVLTLTDASQIKHREHDGHQPSGMR